MSFVRVICWGYPRGHQSLRTGGPRGWRTQLATLARGLLHSALLAAAQMLGIARLRIGRVGGGLLLNGVAIGETRFLPPVDSDRDADCPTQDTDDQQE